MNIFIQRAGPAPKIRVFGGSALSTFRVYQGMDESLGRDAVHVYDSSYNYPTVGWFTETSTTARTNHNIEQDGQHGGYGSRGFVTATGKEGHGFSRENYPAAKPARNLEALCRPRGGDALALCTGTELAPWATALPSLEGWAKPNRNRMFFETTHASPHGVGFETSC